MVKKLFALSICVAQLTVGYAQIKIADDAYKQDMTATKYLTEPLAISNVLSEYDGTYLRDYFNKNIVGDTLYTNGHWAKCLVVNKKDKTIELKSGDVNEGVTIPKGYYYRDGDDSYLPLPSGNVVSWMLIDESEDIWGWQSQETGTLVNINWNGNNSIIDGNGISVNLGRLD